MARANNPTLGTIPCECGRLADVKQRGGQQRRFLYSHCPDCGADQRTGKAVQARLWFGTKWREGMKPSDPPKNVDDTAQEPEPTAPEPEAPAVETVEGDEFKPEKPQPEAAKPKEPTKKGTNFFKGAAAFGGVFLLAVGIIKGL